MRKLAGLVLLLSGVVLHAQTADELLENLDAALFPESYYTEMTMTTSEEGKSDKVIGFESVYKKNVGTLMEIVSPQRSRGMKILQRGTNMWLYDPDSRSKRPVRLSGKNSFQGSAFSNNDVADSQYSDDYDAEITGTEAITHSELGEVEVLTITGIASHAEATYGKIVVQLTAEKRLPLSITYYANSGILMKVMTFSGYKTMAGKIRPSIFTMKYLSQTSVISIDLLEERKDLADSIFSEERLSK